MSNIVRGVAKEILGNQNDIGESQESWFWSRGAQKAIKEETNRVLNLTKLKLSKFFII